MSEVKIQIKNYKLIKEGEFNLSNGTVFFLQAANNKGKTSFLTLLQSIMEVKDSTVNPVTFGEKEGFATGTIPGADGQPYQFRYDFNIDGKNKFQFIGPDNKVIKTITEMRAIFNYNHFTLEEFFEWSKNEPGRKKQRAIFMNLLSEKERDDINEIEAKVNPTSGEFMEIRKLLNKDVDFQKKIVDGIIFNPDQQLLIKNKEQILSLFKSLTKEKEEVEELLKGSDTYDVELRNSIDKQATLNASHAKTSVTLSDTIQNTKEEIKRLQAQLEKDELSLETENNEYEANLKAIETVILELNTKYDTTTIEANKARLNEIKTRLSAGEAKKTALTEIKVLEEQKVAAHKIYETKSKEVLEYDEKIETLRERKKSIIATSANIPVGWSLGDDCITIDGIPFMETDLSKSAATKAIAQLMMRINQSPIMLMGDAEALGYEVLDELDIAAKEAGKIMVFAEHVRSVEELQLVCYDQIEHETKPKANDLF